MLGFGSLNILLSGDLTSRTHILYHRDIRERGERALPFLLFDRDPYLVITSDGPRLTVALNGRVVTRMDLDEWATPLRRPDGSQHKFDVAYKDHPRKGYIGLQDHGAPCWFKNIKIKPLK